EAMAYDLLRLDLEAWHPKQLYKTAALMEQKAQSLRGLDAWIEDFLQTGQLPQPVSEKYPNRCLTDNLLRSAEKIERYTNKTQVAKKLKGMLCATEFNAQVARGWALPPLAECRRIWEARYGGRWEWHSDVSEWRPPMGSAVKPALAVAQGLKPKPQVSK